MNKQHYWQASDNSIVNADSRLNCICYDIDHLEELFEVCCLLSVIVSLDILNKIYMITLTILPLIQAFRFENSWQVKKACLKMLR